MKYVIDVRSIDTCPVGWTSASVWPGTGLYTVRDEPRYAYVVGRDSVILVYEGHLLTSTPYVEFAETVAADDCVSESLFLRAIAAASRAEVLK